MALEFAPPEFQKLTGRWTPPGEQTRKITLLLRVFTHRDIHWLLGEAGRDWFERCNTGNVALTQQIIAHQLENEEQLRRTFQEPDLPLEEVLGRYMPAGGDRQHHPMVQALMDLEEAAMPKERAKKKWRGILVPLLGGSLLGLSTAAAAAWMLQWL